jgi:RimJ/RimL family protein N-acetyltransferase
VVTPTAGAVVLVPFPCSDLSQTKLRPALVLAKANAQDWILAQITSNPYGDTSAIELEQRDFAKGSLNAVSYVRPGKLFTAHQRLMTTHLGELRATLFANILVSVAALFQQSSPQSVPQLTNIFGQPISSPLLEWKVPPPPPRDPMQGKYCRLEPLNPDCHAKDLFEANAHDKEGRNWTYLFDEPPRTFEDYTERLHKMALGSDPLFFTIILNEANKAAGVASYLRITPNAGSIEVGSINFSPLLQRTPASTEAMYLMMKNAFELGYRRYEWKCDALNAPSRKAAQRLGFSYEGIFRQALVYKGRNRDTAWYAVIDREWLRLEAAFQMWLDPSNFDENGKQRVALRDLTKDSRGAGEAREQGS